MQLPPEESKRHKIDHKLQRACRTQWLSTDKAAQGVWQDNVEILQTLSADELKMMQQPLVYSPNLKP